MVYIKRLWYRSFGILVRTRNIKEICIYKKFKPWSVTRVSNWDMHGLISISIIVQAQRIFLYGCYICILFIVVYTRATSCEWETSRRQGRYLFVLRTFTDTSGFFAVNIFLVTYFQVGFLRYSVYSGFKFCCTSL